LKILIAGLGSIGRRHLRNLVAMGQEDILLYRTHQSTLPDEELAPFPVETDLGAALAHKPDGVVVSNPSALHLDIAIPAARAGCHLLLEKPVAARHDQRIEALIQAAKETGIQTLVGFQFRFHPVLARLKQCLESGRLGRVYSFRAHWGEYLPAWHPWEDYRQSYAARQDLGGGVVNTLSHPLDYVRWLFGDVVSLSAITRQVSDLELDVEDVAEIGLVMSPGIIGSIHLDYFQRPPAHWLAVNCEKGSIHWDNNTGAAKIYEVGGETWEVIHPPPGFTRNDLFLEEMRHFLSLINGEVSSRCSLEDGVQALRITSAVHQSSQGHQSISF
jgi:predicted dehydrogenase